MRVGMKRPGVRPSSRSLSSVKYWQDVWVEIEAGRNRPRSDFDAYTLIDANAHEDARNFTTTDMGINHTMGMDWAVFGNEEGGNWASIIWPPPKKRDSQFGRISNPGLTVDTHGTIFGRVLPTVGCREVKYNIR